MRYAAFLRGINVGGNVQVKMEELRLAFTSAGFTEVATLLNSGNVIFEAPETDALDLTAKVESKLEEAFGRKISVILRGAAEMRALIDADPFAGVDVTAETRLYVTFLGGARSTWKEDALAIPYESADRDVKVLRVEDGAICTAITLSPQRATVDLMKFLEGAYGKNVTTRNWNTILKVGQRLAK